MDPLKNDNQHAVKAIKKVGPKIQQILDDKAQNCRLLELKFAGDDVVEILERKQFGEDVSDCQG